MKKLFIIIVIVFIMSCQTQNNLALDFKWKLIELNGADISNAKANITLYFDTKRKYLMVMVVAIVILETIN